MPDHCGSVSEDGAAVCIPGSCSCSSDKKSGEPILLSMASSTEIKFQSYYCYEVKNRKLFIYRRQA